MKSPRTLQIQLNNVTQLENWNTVESGYVAPIGQAKFDGEKPGWQHNQYYMGWSISAEIRSCSVVLSVRFMVQLVV